MGSEMCIRDRHSPAQRYVAQTTAPKKTVGTAEAVPTVRINVSQMTQLSLVLPRNPARMRSLFTVATAASGMPTGQALAHSPYSEQGPK